MILERLIASRANYWLGFVLDGTVSLALIAVAVAGAASWAALAAALALGALVYSLAEYALHRWLYHRPASPFGRVHAAHHRDPAAVHGAPFFFSLAVCAGALAAASRVTTFAHAAGFAGALLLAFAAQGAIHHLVHRGAGGPEWLTRLRAHHLHHHRHGEVNFGVSTTLWDRVFGTLARPGGS